MLTMKPGMASKVHMVIQAIEKPLLNLIFQDADWEERNNYYGPGIGKKAYTKAVVEFLPLENRGHVVTAFLTDKVKPGEDPIWPT